MSGDIVRGRRPSQGIGHGQPLTTLDDTSIATMFDHNIPDHIRRDVVSMEEEETHRGRSSLWAHRNAVDMHMKGKEGYKTKATKGIIELSMLFNHSSYSLKHLAKGLDIDQIHIRLYQCTITQKYT